MAVIPPVDAFVQVRLSSRRLPGKALINLGDDTCLGHVLRRARRARRLRNVVVCTSTEPDDDPLVDVAKAHRLPFFRGSADDCVERFLQCAREFDSGVVVRICGDSPLIDPSVIDAAIESLVTSQVDYVATRQLPVGAYVEVFTHAALERAWLTAVDRRLSDDLTYYLNRPEINRVGEFLPPPPLRRPDLVLALNRPEDLVLLARIFDDASPSGRLLTLHDAIAYCDAHPDLAVVNSAYQPVATQCDTRLDLNKVPPRPPELSWFEPYSVLAQRGRAR